MGMNVDTSLFKGISTIVIPATTKVFIAREKFVLNGIKICHHSEWTGVGNFYWNSTSEHYVPHFKNRTGFVSFSDNFIDWFLKARGKIENPICAHTLYYQKLKASADTITTEKLSHLCAKKKTTLTEMFYFTSLCEKSKKKDGVLFDVRRSNCLFWIEDTCGVLRSVRARFLGDGWTIEAGPAIFPNDKLYKLRDSCNWQVGEYAFFSESHISS